MILEAKFGNDDFGSQTGLRTYFTGLNPPPPGIFNFLTPGNSTQNKALPL